MDRAYRQREWEAVCSGPTELSVSSYTEDYRRNGYDVDLRNGYDVDLQGVVRLYVRKALASA